MCLAIDVDVSVDARVEALDRIKMRTDDLLWIELLAVHEADDLTR